MTTLYAEMTSVFIHQCRKHDLAPNADQYAREQLDAMSPSELVYALSNALEALKGESVTVLEAIARGEPVSYKLRGMCWNLWTPSSLANPHFSTPMVEWKVGVP
jgi:hypothetical protein